MPRFLNPKAKELNTLNAAKRKVVKRNKKKYASVLPDLEATAEQGLAPTPSGDEKSFIGLYSNIANAQTALEEMISSVKVYADEARSYGALVITEPAVLQEGVRDFVKVINPISTSLAKSASGALATLRALNFNISSFSEDEKDQIASAYTAFHRKNKTTFRRALRELKSDFIDEDTAQGLPDRRAKWETIQPIFKRFTDLLDELDTQLGNAVKAYRQIPEGAGFRRGGARSGGAEYLVADSSEERLTRGYGNQSPLAPIYSAFPPRRTQDLFDMPRRFQ